MVSGSVDFAILYSDTRWNQLEMYETYTFETILTI